MRYVVHRSDGTGPENYQYSDDAWSRVESSQIAGLKEVDTDPFPVQVCFS